MDPNSSPYVNIISVNSSKPPTNNSEDLFADFISRCAELGIDADSEAIAKIQLYCSKLQEYNAHTNLVGNDELSILLNDHILDSLTLLPIIREKAPTLSVKKLVDIGSGAGFPGIILPLLEASLRVKLIDSTAKKCRFLELISNDLDISNRVMTICDRAEVLAHNSSLRAAFDFATARAVGSLKLVSELSLPFLKIGGFLLAQRSAKQVQEELESSKSFIKTLGGAVLEQHTLSSNISKRDLQILIIQKQEKTPTAYPRDAAQIKRSNA